LFSKDQGHNRGKTCTANPRAAPIKIKCCDFGFRLTYAKKHSCWALTRFSASHHGHFPRQHIPHKLDPTDGCNLANWRNVHGISTSALLSLLREQGKLVTTQQVFNALNGYAASHRKGSTESDTLLQEMCRDSQTVMVVRFHILDASGANVGELDLLRIPGSKFLFPLKPDQMHDKCRNIHPFDASKAGLCSLDRYIRVAFSSC
jgi:hypothetical protein